MTRRRLLIQALVVTALGSVQLFTPQKARAAAQSAMCGSSCGVCFSGFECPDLSEQNYDCDQLCDAFSVSCGDCSDFVPDCPIFYQYGWTCGF